MSHSLLSWRDWCGRRSPLGDTALRARWCEKPFVSSRSKRWRVPWSFESCSSRSRSAFWIYIRVAVGPLMRWPLGGSRLLGASGWNGAASVPVEEASLSLTVGRDRSDRDLGLRRGGQRRGCGSTHREDPAPMPSSCGGPRGQVVDVTMFYLGPEAFPWVDTSCSIARLMRGSRLRVC